MKYIKDYNAQKMIDFFKRHITYKNTATVSVDWNVFSLMKKQEKAILNIGVHVKKISGDHYNDWVNISIPCVIDSFTFDCDNISGYNEDKNSIFEKDRDTYLSLLQNDWRRFVYEHLKAEEKECYLNELREYIQLNEAETFDSKEKLEDYLSEIKNDLPFGALSFYRENQGKFKEIEKGNIEALLQVKTKRNELRAYFAKFDVDITDIKKSKVITNLDLSKENIDLLQKHLVVLCEYFSDESIDNYLNELLGSAISTEKLRLQSETVLKKLSSQDKKKLLEKYLKQKQNLIEEILDVEDDVYSEVKEKIEEFSRYDKLLKENEEILNIYEKLQYDFYHKANSMIELSKLGKQANKIIKTNEELYV